MARRRPRREPVVDAPPVRHPTGRRQAREADAQAFAQERPDILKDRDDSKGTPVSNLQRILNLASKALDKKTQSSSGTGKTDWRGIVRTAADRVTGDSRPATGPAPVRPPVSSPADATTRTAASATAPAASPEDRAAIARYDYLLKTAQPEQLEQVHRDAFARLSPDQREQVGLRLRAELPTGEQPASTSADDLARSATRGEAHNPGFLRRVFASPTGRGAGAALAGAGVGAAGGMALGAAGGLFAAVAGGAVLSSVAAPLLEQAAGLGVDFESLSGGLDGVTENLAGGVDGITQGAGDYASGLGDQVSELGSNFEIPGLGSLGGLFGRE